MSHIHWAAFAFLAVLFLAGPVGRKLLHARALRRLAIPGTTVISRWWGLSGLCYERDGWRGEVLFGAPGEKWGGRQGHLLFRGTLKRAAPSVSFQDPPVEDVARRILVPQMRELMGKVRDRGGRVLDLREGTIEIAGPLLSRPDELKSFLDLCEAILERTAAAVSSSS